MEGSISRGRAALVSLFSAITALDQTRKTWEQAARTAEADRAAWSAHDLTSSRTRAQCVEDLIKQGVAKTNAQTQASDHPIYKAHRDQNELLAKAKEQSELEKQIAYQQLEAAKLKVLAMIEFAHAGGFGDEVMLEQIVSDSYNQGFDAAFKKAAPSEEQIDQLEAVWRHLNRIDAHGYAGDVAQILALYRPADPHEVRERDRNAMLHGKASGCTCMPLPEPPAENCPIHGDAAPDWNGKIDEQPEQLSKAQLDDLPRDQLEEQLRKSLRSEPAFQPDPRD